jgi:hypothetical protein
MKDSLTFKPRGFLRSRNLLSSCRFGPLSEKLCARKEKKKEGFSFVFRTSCMIFLRLCRRAVVTSKSHDVCVQEKYRCRSRVPL